MNLKFRTKLLLINCMVIGAMSIVVVIGVYSIVARQMRHETNGFLHDEFREYSLKYEALLDRLDVVREDMFQHFTKARMTYPILCRLFDEQEALVIDVENVPGSPPPDLSKVREALNGKEIEYKTKSSANGKPYWFAIRPLISPSNKKFAFELGLNVDHLEKRVSRLKKNLFFFMFAMVVMTTLVAFYITRQTMKPIEEMNEKLDIIRSTSLNSRLPIRGAHDEIDELAIKVNAMLVEIEESFNLIRDFTADAAHELRTPIARLMVMFEQFMNQSIDEKTIQETIDIAYEECYRLQKLIDDLMLLARLDTGQEIEAPIDCDIQSIVHELEEIWNAACEEKQIDFYVETIGDLSIHGKPILLRRLFSNLVDNAIQNTPASGRIVLAAHANSKMIEISVWNTGPGIPAESIPKLFHRFFRLEHSRNTRTGGFGLGLHICQKICALHRGAIEVKSVEQEWTQFIVRLPKDRHRHVDTSLNATANRLS